MNIKFILLLLLSLNLFSSQNIKSLENKHYHKISIPKEILRKFGLKYRKNALKRIILINNTLDQYKDKSLTAKLHAINLLVNKLNFSQDIIHWKQKNYLATPLEFIGTGIGDSDDFAHLKLLLLIKLNVDVKKLKIIKKNTPLVLNGVIIKKNISLAYFDSLKDTPIILDYKKNRSKIYRYQKEFQYKVIKYKKNSYINKVLYGDISIFNVHKLFKIFK